MKDSISENNSINNQNYGQTHVNNGKAKTQLFNQLLNGFFIWFGRKYHRIEHWINYRVIKSVKSKETKAIKEEMALEKGIEGLYQIFFYSIVIGIPLYEMHKSAVSTETKEKKLNQRVEGMQNNLEKISEKLALLNEQSNSVNNTLFSVSSLSFTNSTGIKVSQYEAENNKETSNTSEAQQLLK